jgi:hypothetical protein
MEIDVCIKPEAVVYLCKIKSPKIIQVTSPPPLITLNVAAHRLHQHHVQRRIVLFLRKGMLKIGTFAQLAHFEHLTQKN